MLTAPLWVVRHGAEQEQHGSMGTSEASADDSAPDPNDDRKPGALTEIEARTWKYVARKSWREFMDDECQDLAAALDLLRRALDLPGGPRAHGASWAWSERLTDR